MVKQKSSQDDKAKSKDTRESNSQDPVRLYLREVGKTPLLNHAREIEISKAIESSKQTIMDTLFAIPMTVRTIDSWIADIQSGKTPVSEVFDLDGGDDDELEAQRPREQRRVNGLEDTHQPVVVLRDFAAQEIRAQHRRTNQERRVER